MPEPQHTRIMVGNTIVESCFAVSEKSMTSNPGVPVKIITWHSASVLSAPWGQTTRYTTLEGDIGPGWKLIRPLPIKIEQDEDGYYVVSDDLFLVYGEAATLEEAEQDYIVSLRDYYQIIATRAAEGHAPTQKLLQQLETYLQRVNS